jgi:hypothetical protein
MRILRTPPKHRDFYNEHGGSLTAYRWIANLGQLLSGASLALAVYTLLGDALRGRGISADAAIIAGVALAVGFFVELANRMLAKPSIKPLVVKDQFADDEEKARRHKVLTRMSRAGLFIVGGLSLVLSFMGSVEFADVVTAEAETLNVDSLEIARSGAIDAATASFAADTAALLAPFSQRVTAAKNEFSAIRAEREKAAEKYLACAEAGNKWCKTKRRGIFGEIDAAQASLNATLAAIATERGQTLAQLIQKRDEALKAANAKADQRVSKAEAANATAQADREADAAGKGYIFAALTLAGQMVFYLMVFLILQIEAGSEIDHKIEPNEFWHLPGVVAELRTVVAHRVERGARRFIRYIFGERDRLTEGVPYVGLFPEEIPAVPQPDTISPARSNGKAHNPEAEVLATAYVPPGFYQSGSDPHTQGEACTPLLHTKKTPNTDTKHETAGLSASDLKQRLRQYKKRLGSHEQKAIRQRRETGEVKARTSDAIANNRRWVAHYEELLKNLNHGKNH